MGWIRIPEVKWKEAEIVYGWLLYFNRTCIFYVLHCSWHAKSFLQFFDSDLKNVDLTSPSLYIYQCISYAALLLNVFTCNWCPTVQCWYLRSLHGIFQMEFCIGWFASLCRCCAAAGCAGLDIVQRTLHHCTAFQPCPSAPVYRGLGGMSRICSRGGPVSEQRMGWHGCTGDVYFSI